jgi:hypothetical protein
VARTFFWEESPTELFKEFIDRAKKKNVGAQSISSNSEDENGMPIEFQEYIAGVFEVELDYPVEEWKFWIGVMRSGEVNRHKKQFAKGFPHAHGWDALTAVHYVQVPESGGDLVIVDRNNKTLHRFPPKVGMTAVVDGGSLHGIEVVFGEVERYTLIATGFKAKTQTRCRSERS